MNKGRKIIKTAILSLVILTAVIGIAGYTYLSSTGYAADAAALAAMKAEGAVSIYRPEQDVLVFMPEEPEAGLIFYPGGRVDHTAYAPLLRALAEEGIACVLLQMPFDLAVLDMDAAEKARGTVAGIDAWYLGGHSLGGAMAASFAAEHSEDYDGLVLLAAYSTEDLKSSDLKVVSLYGSEDGVLDMENYAAYRSNLPADTVEGVLEGGNHAQFGSYGLQKGDGTADVTAQEQIDWAVEIISGEILR